MPEQVFPNHILTSRHADLLNIHDAEFANMSFFTNYPDQIVLLVQLVDNCTVNSNHALVTSLPKGSSPMQRINVAL